MPSRTFGRVVLAALMFGLTTAQDSVPSDLKTGFESSGTQLQASYTNDAVDGFTDGTTFEKDQVANEPQFALGDSSGISSTTLYTIVMIDTTDDNARTLHYARSNFKYNFDITKLETTDQPLLEYKAPGAFGETGDDRKYTFLMYLNPGRKQITSLKLPGEGQTFDVKQFQSDNGFSDAGAGLGMTVKLGGQSSPSQSSATSQSSSATAAESSASATSVTSATTQASSAASSAASSTATGDSQSNSSSRNGRTSATDLAPASTVLQSSASAPSASASTVRTSVVPSATGSSTTSGTPAQSTGGGTSLTLGMAHGMTIASLVAFAGVLVWY